MEDWAFLSHRLPMARSARDSGFDVVIATRVSKHLPEIEAEGFRVVHMDFRRGDMNPFTELGTVIALIRLMRREKPDIVHNIALKAILDGSLAAMVSPVGYVVNSFTGMGAVFTGNLGLGLLRAILTNAFRLLMRRNNTRVIVQNDDDQAQLAALGIGRPSRTTKICGSGVDTTTFQPSPEPPGPVTVTMVSRLLWDKGISELMEAAQKLRDRGAAARIVIVGTPDPENPKSIDEATFMRWRSEGLVEFQGHRTDIAQVWAQSHIAVLPSYREGLPKSLLEGASCGRPMIATNVPGCRELVLDGINGLLVPARDAIELANAIEGLSTDSTLRKKLGTEARRLVEQKYSDNVIKHETIKLYSELLGNPES